MAEVDFTPKWENAGVLSYSLPVDHSAGKRPPVELGLSKNGLSQNGYGVGGMVDGMVGDDLRNIHS